MRCQRLDRHERERRAAHAPTGKAERSGIQTIEKAIQVSRDFAMLICVLRREVFLMYCSCFVAKYLSRG
jgi:hypothetical protein